MIENMPRTNVEPHFNCGIQDMGFECSPEQLNILLVAFFPASDIVEEEAGDEAEHDDFTEKRAPAAASINYHVSQSPRGYGMGG